MSLISSLRHFQISVLKNWQALITLSAIIIFVTGMTLIIAGRNHLYDPSLYHQYAQNIFAGKIPYCGFPLEYPPLALVPMIIPQLLTLGKPTHLYIYSGIFAFQILFYSLITVLILANYKGEFTSNLYPKKYLIEQGIFLIVLAPLIFWRYDLFPGLISLLALISAASFPFLSGILLAVGFASKLYPILGVPFFVIYYFIRKQYRDLRFFLMGFSGIIAVAVIPFLLNCPSQFYQSIRFHQLRGLQITSIPANFLLLGHQFLDLNIEIIKNYGAEHLKTSLAEPLIKLFPVIFILIYVTLIYRFICTMNQYDQVIDSPASFKLANYQNILIGYTTLAIAVFIATNKVFSTQYLMWLAPIVPLLSRKLQITFFFVCLMHSTLAPFMYSALVKLELLPILTLSLGNALLIYFIFQLFREYVSRPKLKGSIGF